MFVVQARRFLRKYPIEDKVRTITIYKCLTKENDEDRKERVANKLNSLLQSIIKEETKKENDKTISLQTKFKKIKYPKPAKPKTLGEKIVDAAKEVAVNVDGKPEQTEAEILHKLLHKDDKLKKSVLSLTQNKVLSDLLNNMKVEKTPPPEENFKASGYNRAEHVRHLLKNKSRDISRLSSEFKTPTKFDLFSGKLLEIFDTDKLESSERADELKIWENCVDKDIKLSVTHPPANIFEEMIVWTNRGILWKFPIDNDQGLDDERKVSFADHVFLETHIEDWCPEKGPIRHFMELVCVGLSRNHWLSAQEKKEHILWYKEYFAEKKDLIKEIGAGDVKLSQSSTNN